MDSCSEDAVRRGGIHPVSRNLGILRGHLPLGQIAAE